MSTQSRSLLALSFLFVVAGACEKSGKTDIKGSGDITDSEKKLLAHVPADSNLVFGANYADFAKYWKNSPIRKMSEMMMKSMGSQDKLKEYMNCWFDDSMDMKLAGGIGMAGGTMAMTMVFEGMSDKTLSTCAEKGSLKIKRDDDGKYLELQGVPDGMGGTSNVGYYFVGPDTVFFSMEMPFGGGDMKNAMAGRAQLVARAEKAAKSPASKSDKIKAMMAKADRKRAFWFAGSAEGTPAASQLSGGQGYLDAEKDALTIGFSVVLTSADDAKQAVSQYNQLKGQVGMLPAEIKGAVEEILKDAKLSASGKTLNGKFRLSNSALNKMIPFLESSMGGI